MKRDAKQRDNEILVARLVDRPLRPMFPQGWANDTQVLTWVMSYDGVHRTEPLAITAASAALVISGQYQGPGPRASYIECLACMILLMFPRCTASCILYQGQKLVMANIAVENANNAKYSTFRNKNSRTPCES